MADPLSVAGSAVGIISLGLTVAQGLFRIADGIGSAGEEVRSYAEEINAFSRLLCQVKTEVERSTDISPNIQSVINDVLDLCNRVLKPLNGLQSTLQPLLDHFRSSPRKLLQLGLRIQWLFRIKGKVLFYRNALKEQHRLLDTILAIINLHAIRARCPQDTYIMQLCLQNSIAAIDLSHRADPQMGFRMLIEESPSEPAGIFSHRGASEGEDISILRLSTTPNESGVEIGEQVALDAEERIEHELDSETAGSAQEIWQDTCVLRRKVLRFALRTTQSEMGSEMATDRFDRKEYTVCLICTHTKSYAAAITVLDAEHETPDSLPASDNNLYTLGELGKHKVVIIPVSGIVSAAAGVAQVRHSFPSIRFGVIFTTGGGVPSATHDIRLGDVVVGTPRSGTGGVIHLDRGKEIQSGHQLNRPPSVLLAAVNSLWAQYQIKGSFLGDSIDKLLEKYPRLREGFARPCESSDRLYPAHYQHHCPDEPCEAACDPSVVVLRSERYSQEDKVAVHLGLVASGIAMMRDVSVRDRLAAEMDVMCFEDSASGVMNILPSLVICGICEYSDSHNYEQWVGYAAMAAAVYARDLLYKIPLKT